MTVRDLKAQLANQPNARGAAVSEVLFDDLDKAGEISYKLVVSRVGMDAEWGQIIHDYLEEIGLDPDNAAFKSAVPILINHGNLPVVVNNGLPASGPKSFFVR